MAGFDPIGSVNVAPLGLQNPRPVFMGTGLGALFQALQARNQEGRDLEETKAEMLRREREFQLRQQQEQRLRDWQQGQLQLDRDKMSAEQRQKGMTAVGEAYTKNPDTLPFVAQAYGGKIEDVTRPPGPALADIDEDPSAEPVSQGFQPTGKQRLTMPGMDAFEFDKPSAEDEYSRLEATLDRLPQTPMVQAQRVAIEQARAMKLPGKETIADMREIEGRYGRADLARELAQMRQRKGGGGGTKTGPGSKSADDARSDLNAYLGNQGYKADVASNRQFDRMISAADEASKGNASAARVFMGMFTKFAQGETGVLTAADMDIFWNSAGSPKDRSEEALEKLVSGGLGRTKQAAAVKAIQALKQTATSRMDAMYEGAAEVMKPYGADGERWLRAYFGRGQRAPKGSGGHDEADALLKGLR